MTHDYDVLLLGSYFCDLIFTGLPEVPRLSADLFGTDFDMVPGATFTVAVAFKRLGIHAGWSCDFGDDFFSRFILDRAREEGLDNSLFRVHARPLRHISVSFSFTHDRGFISYMDPYESHSPLPLVERHRPRAVLISSLQHGEAHAALVDAARNVGALVYMDCQCHTASLDTPSVVEALRRVDIFAPNQGEALQITGAATVEEALHTLAALTPTVIIKRGGEGAIAQSDGQVVSVPALPVEVFDTTGAGDSFNAGFLYGHLRGRPLDESLRCGAICGSLATTARGAAALPSAAQVEEWLRRAEEDARS